MKMRQVEKEANRRAKQNKLPFKFVNQVNELCGVRAYDIMLYYKASLICTELQMF